MFFIINILFLNIPIEKNTCVSVSDWLQYTFFDLPLFDHGFCIINHTEKYAQMSESCEENLPSIECFFNSEQ